MGNMRFANIFVLEKSEFTTPLIKPGNRWKIILKGVLKRRDMM
jgi:hypothetical protein